MSWQYPIGMQHRMSIGMSCPPGSKQCNIKGEPDPHSGTIQAKARLTDSHEETWAEAVYAITEDFIDYAAKQMPEGLYATWLPRPSNGFFNTDTRKQMAQGNHQHIIQRFFCNHAFAHLTLGQLAAGEDASRTFKSDDIGTVFSFSSDLPDMDDFMARAQALSKTAHGMEFLATLASPHIALFYGVTLRTADTFLQHLATRGLVEECSQSTGYDGENVRSCVRLTREGLEYKAAPKHKPSCFVVMPFNGLDASYGVMEAAWREVFGDAPLLRQDKDPDGGGRRLIDEKILTNIANSSVVLADLSLGEKEMQAHRELSNETKQRFAPLNPNVMFEVGYALRCSQEESSNCQEVFLIAQNPAAQFLQGRVFDLRNRTIHPYERSEEGLRSLQVHLIDLLQHFKNTSV